MTLRQRLLALTAVALLPALLAVVYNEVALRRSREAEIHEQALRYGRQANFELEQIVSGVRAVLIAVSAVPAVANFEREPCQSFLSSVREKVPGLSNIAAIGADGKLACDSEGTPPGLDLADRPYLAEALKSNEFVVGEFARGRLTGRPVLPLALPIRDAQGRAKGVVVSGVRLDWLGARLKERGVSPDGSLTVADRRGIILARDPSPEQFVGTRIPEAFLHLVHAPLAGTLELVSQDGTRRILGYVPVSQTPIGLYVSAGISKDNAFAAIDRASLVAGLLAGLGALAAFVLAWLFGGIFIRRPVERLLAAVQAWRLGDTDARTGLQARHGELEAVGAALDQLMDELAARQAARQQSEEARELLTREMSHRVKNTLAIVQALASQTFSRPEVPRERRQAFQQRLAALAGAYDVLLARDREGAALDAVIEDAIRPYEEAGRFSLAGPELDLKPDAVLAFTMAVHELSTNALKYGALSVPEGKVDIAWKADDRLVLVWSERGGPPVAEPAATGFGTRLLNGAFPAVLEPRIDLRFEPLGLVCTIDLLLAPLLAEEAAKGEDRAVA